MVEILEQRLMEAGRGDHEAAAAVYDDVAEVVYGLVLHMTGDPERAEALACDALLAVLRTASLFDPAQGSARSWIVGVAHQHAVRSRRSTRPQESGTPMLVPGLAALSGPDARAVGLSWFGARTYGDVAQDTGESHDRVLARLRGALLDLGSDRTAPEPWRST
ncbi:sigma factor [Nocardioides furvisabuli]|uniref:RNA polymerase sigma-70 region 2 domain-containing protein n=1 Tax=Nocardioides furvisabuli TaxID=375542 RepID=A0ABN2XK73_9ACTN|nr:sigma factor [Nocardioides furvisabuli]